MQTLELIFCENYLLLVLENSLKLASQVCAWKRIMGEMLQRRLWKRRKHL
jgi:hypothetical protein